MRTPHADRNEAPAQDESAHRALIERRIRHFYERRAANDPDGMYEFADPDVTYQLGSYRSYPFQATRRGKAECLEMSRAANIFYENLGSEILDLVIDGDSAAIRRLVTVRERGTGAAVAVNICNFFTFRDGLITGIAEFPDTLALCRLKAMNADPGHPDADPLPEPPIRSFT